MTYFSKLNLRGEKWLILFFSLPMGSLDDKEPFYAHFLKFGPFGAKWGGGGRYGPPPLFTINFSEVGPRAQRARGGSKFFWPKMFLIER